MHIIITSLDIYIRYLTVLYLYHIILRFLVAVWFSDSRSSSSNIVHKIVPLYDRYTYTIDTWRNTHRSKPRSFKTYIVLCQLLFMFGGVSYIYKFHTFHHSDSSTQVYMNTIIPTNGWTHDGDTYEVDSLVLRWITSQVKIFYLA